jgi:hypothetical protein
MEIRVYTIKLNPPRWLRNVIVYAVMPIGALVGATAVVRAAITLTPFTTGMPIKAAEVNTNFTTLGDAVTALQAQVSGLPARVGVVARSVERTGSVAPNSQGWTQIPGLTTTFTLTQDSLVEMAGNGVQRTVNQNAATLCQVGYRYVVDGVPKGDALGGQRLHVSSGGVSWHSTWSIIDSHSLGPGQHTIALQANNSGYPSGSSCYVCAELDGGQVGYESCTMNIVAIPK